MKTGSWKFASGMLGAVLLAGLSCGAPPVSVDAGTDAGSETSDAGTGTDAGTGGDAGTDAGTGSDAGTDGGTPGASTRIRLMAANLTSGNNQSYDLGEGIRLMQGVKPDIVLIQEFKYGTNTPADIQNFVNTTFGSSFSWYREAGGGIPNGIISRWPIIASGEWEDTYAPDRDFAWARIDIPGPRDLWAISVHLLTANATTRNNEATSLVQFIQANVPASDYLVIGGDLNTDNRSESCFTTFSQVVVTSGAFPVDQNSNGNTNASRARPYDHVLVDADLRAYTTSTVIGVNAFPSGLVLDSRVYTPLSEIAPVRSTDSGATNMQHMGVIKDFLVPSDEALQR